MQLGKTNNYLYGNPHLLIYALKLCRHKRMVTYSISREYYKRTQLNRGKRYKEVLSLYFNRKF